ncbi:MAG: hypothetical protein GY883_21670 [Shimia sp.]|nr:hypothetical protein [Shimia sp.]
MSDYRRKFAGFAIVGCKVLQSVVKWQSVANFAEWFAKLQRNFVASHANRGMEKRRRDPGRLTGLSLALHCFDN